MPRLSPYTEDKFLSSSFIDETAAPTQSRIFKLVTLEIPGSDIPFTIVDSNYEVTFDGINYAPFPFKVNASQINTDGSIDKTSIAVANVSREMMGYVESYNGLRNKRVAIKTVYESVLDFIYYPNSDGTVAKEENPKANNTAFTEEEYLIDTYTANEQLITFMLEPVIDLNVRIPRRRYMVDTCYWHYMDSETCRHSGVFSGPDTSLTAGSTEITIGQLKADTSVTSSVAVSYEEYLAIMHGVDSQSQQEAYLYYLDQLAKGMVVSIGQATTSDYSTYSTMKPTTGTIITVGDDPTHYSIASVKTNTDASGDTTSWTCTVSPIPETSTIGTIRFVTCNKTLADCKFRLNVKNYGGFPGVSGSRRIML